MTLAHVCSQVLAFSIPQRRQDYTTGFHWPMKVTPPAPFQKMYFLSPTYQHYFLASWIPASTLKNSSSWLGGPSYDALHWALNNTQFVMTEPALGKDIV